MACAFACAKIMKGGGKKQAGESREPGEPLKGSHHDAKRNESEGIAEELVEKVELGGMAFRK